MDVELTAQLIDKLQVGIILLDHQGLIVFWNDWISAHSRRPAEEACGKRLDEVFPEIQGSRLEGSIDQALRSRLSSMLAPGLSSGVLPLYAKKANPAVDQRMQQLVYITPLRHAQCACLIQIQDMTATVRRERRLRAQSSELMATTHRDPLTGVGNRRRFDKDLADIFRRAQAEQTSLGLLMIDVDDFKAYNDRFGHPKGDECLITVAQTLKQESRATDAQVSRYGGEEFGLPLPNITLKTACGIAERLRLRISELRIPHPDSRVSGHITVSIGVSTLIPRQDQSADILLAQADLALYTAKDRGRNVSVCFDSERNDLRGCN